MLSSPVFCLIIQIVALACSLLSAAPSCPSIFRWLRQPHKRRSLFRAIYRDQDGVATEESMYAFSDWGQRAGFLLCIVAGAALSLARAISTTLTNDPSWVLEHWLQFGAWISLLVPGGALLVETEPTVRFTHGLRGSFGCLLVMLGLCTEAYTHYVLGDSSYADPQLETLIAQITASFSSFGLGLLLPRRPDVFHNGAIVDQKDTHSFLSRLSFGWAGGLLESIRHNRAINIQDLPELDFRTRSANLQDAFDRTRAVLAASARTSLWKVLVVSHRKALVSQLILTVANAILTFAPQISFLGILRALESASSTAVEEEEDNIQQDASVWLWVLALGMSIMISATLENWNYWVSSNDIAVRLYEQLSVVIFDKALRSQDGPRSSAEQNILSLVAVDAKRVADFASLNFMIYEAPLKVVIAGILIARLLGWQSLLAAIGVLFVLTLVNVYAIRRYSVAQHDLLSWRDRKLSTITEALQGIRQIKFSALESHWERRINTLRDNELQRQWDAFCANLFLMAMYVLGPILISAACLMVYALQHGQLSASVAFTAISVFGTLEVSLAVLPEMLANGVNAVISLARIDAYLQDSEKEDIHIPGPDISFHDATISWYPQSDRGDSPFSLRNVSLNLPSAGLTVITGPTGSGKSLLMAAILGECAVSHGLVTRPVPPAGSAESYDETDDEWIVPSSIAYVAQTPWIENCSLQENVLFGLPYNARRYQQVIRACALDKDLENLVDGETTELGAQGVNLSGGQRWRLTLARALYSRAGILILEDIFSAVDAHTAHHLYEHALTGELAANRTRILVTHHLHLCLPHADYLVSLDQTGIRYSGSVSELRSKGLLCDLDAQNTDDPTTAKQEPKSALQACVFAPDDDEDDTPKSHRRFVEEEERASGNVKWAVYWQYMQQVGGSWRWLALVVAFISYSGLMLGRGWWLNIWTNKSEQASATVDVMFYLGIYVLLSLLACITGVLRSYLALSSALRASQGLFHQVLSHVLRAPLQWLNTVPMGRVLNRFAADFNLVDSRLGYDFNYAFAAMLEVVAIILAGSLVNGWLLLLSLLPLSLCVYYAWQFLTVAREIKRLESTTRSPVLELFRSALDGLATIRAFEVTDRYRQLLQGKVDQHAQAAWNLWLLIRWLGFRMSTVGALFTTLAAAILVSMQGVTPALAGFAISFIIRYSAVVSQAIRQYANLEMSMNSIERVTEYSNIPCEEAKSSNSRSAPAAWPTGGRLDVSDLVVSYSPDLPPVLAGVSFHVESNQRVGIVGRTGAGKSSLALALFRLIEAQQGSIFVDGLDIAEIPLEQLRSRLAIIPQDPILFAGTIRSNLDPLDQYGDGELIEALVRVHWPAAVTMVAAQESDEVSVRSIATTITLGTISSSNLLDVDDETVALRSYRPIPSRSVLDVPVTEGGCNMSQGQRQLLCLARAIVSRPKMVVLDEATSAVDKDTDALIQQSIRDEFGRNATTLLVIAHRLSTVADFDRILVLEAGRVVEYGSPAELVSKRGAFFSLVEESPERAYLRSVIAEAGHSS
ncbi:hypothetical protein ASPZODRAFT_20284 [Penicilliopsis zonata CBS 506.65]|uniref:P-loop containing nucleoside triphosphate hydrolase protein n=1 Tax=Penicilliopsis zonata CBS 506.65 TaxID=1073090 RepID=A0A1L9S6I8_9EURO|nr:hypothetical protein ASPZODRAFT_20284 [Penicilliopsis zonata CBS 506.65]OJJ42757.1 hypothetical protein ASPZODRAFT_20284 [Penicilliopsis zonata CBS 506.65]